MRARSFAALIVTAALAIPAGAETGSKQIAEEVLARYAEAYNRGDAAGLARVYTEDAVFLPQGGKVVKGRGAIEAFWKNGLGQDLVLVVEAAEVSGKVGWAAGSWSLATGDPKQRATGLFVVGLRQDADGLWRLSSDTYNNPCGR